ncbi:MAG TPA: winged helix DNA-binding domain-containing protein [Thermoleophilaceae bacterium]
MPPEVLTQRHLNRALLARQLLLERGRGGIPRTLERVGGIQAQYAPSMYVGLWSRIEGFEREQLTRALERRSVAQGTLLRITIHLVSAGDWWPFAVAVREARRRWLLTNRAEAGGARRLEPAARKLRAAMAGGSMTTAEIRSLLGKALGYNAPLWIDMVRVPPSGTWDRRRADLYACAEDWLGPPDGALDVDAAVDHLVRSCLRGFGPMPGADVANFTGVAAADVAASLERLELRTFVDEQGKELVDLPRAPLPDPDTPAPVRFLPVWDATMLLATIRRTGIFPERHRAALANTSYPQAAPLFLVDGVVAGAWKFEAGRVRMDPFEKLDRATLRALREEAERLTDFAR